jgi:hypothetical protein
MPLPALVRQGMVDKIWGVGGWGVLDIETDRTIVVVVFFLDITFAKLDILSSSKLDCILAGTSGSGSGGRSFKWSGAT